MNEQPAWTDLKDVHLCSPCARALVWDLKKGSVNEKSDNQGASGLEKQSDDGKDTTSEKRRGRPPKGFEKATVAKTMQKIQAMKQNTEES